ncbi:hypothetical protein FACS1894206_07600 [Deltaproteobacteria bacterium]|nr:hypothetical protein FACS1894206_07600 [Deltaproteobacteria bacterium]
MGRIGWTEILLIFVVFTALFGHKKLPSLGRSIGRGVRNFTRAMGEADEIDSTAQKTRTGQAGNKGKA